MKMIIAAALTAASTMPAIAAPQCGPTDAIRDVLSNSYDESVVSRGITGGGTAIVEMWSNRKTGTWSVVVTQLNGTSCLISAGSDWQEMPRGDPA